VTDLAAAHPAGLWRSMTRLYRLLSAHRRRQFYFVMFLMLLGALGELAALGAVLPFLTLLASPGHWGHFAWLGHVVDRVAGGNPNHRLAAATMLFIALALIAGLLRLQLTWSSQSFVFQLGHELSVEIQRRTLLQPYAFHIGKNSSALIASLENVQRLVFDVLSPLMQAGTAIFISGFIVAALVYIDPFTAIVAAASLGLIYLILTAFTRRAVAMNSQLLSSAYDQRVKIVQESLGGIRDILIDSSQAVFVEAFRAIDRRWNSARVSTAFIATAPRYMIEALGMVLLALLANLLAGRPGGVGAAIPILGALALGAQRLLPLWQQVYTGWTVATGHASLVPPVLDLLELPLPAWVPRAAVEPLALRERIALEDVGFSYGGPRARALDSISLEIPRGSTVGLIGRTGSGKSTLADLLMGLLEPTHGRITVDGVPITGENRQRWWRSIAHVPQAIFLADDTIARNIAFGLAEEAIDINRMIDASAQAQLHEFVASLPDGYNTRIGERGVRLSGGQRQRLGIARAIYKGAPVMVLDEATSALDDATEAAVMNSIAKLGREGRTIIVIAHRTTTIARCDIVARLDNGRLVDVGSRAKLLGRARKRAVGDQ
jgi:ABC-type multidrug transport system fused ATPase/permease subunit